MPSGWMQKTLQMKYDEHKKRIKEARSTIDKKPPPSMPMSMRREIERRRVQNLIEFDNRLLLDRLGVAMSKKNIDNELKAKPFTSYIELQRKRELKKITVENQKLLHRIQTTVPSYHVEDWEKDAEKRVEYLRNMTEFPDYFVPPGTRSSSKKDLSKTRTGQSVDVHGRNDNVGYLESDNHVPNPPEVMNSMPPPVRRPVTKGITLPPIV